MEGDTVVNGSATSNKVIIQQVVIDGKSYQVIVDNKGCPSAPPSGLDVFGSVSTISSLAATEGASRIQLELSTPNVDDQPLYVNAKQYHRILKRRQQRSKLEASGKIPKTRQKYLYASRHKHAVNRQRGALGRFSSPTTESSQTYVDKKSAAAAKRGERPTLNVAHITQIATAKQGIPQAQHKEIPCDSTTFNLPSIFPILSQQGLSKCEPKFSLQSESADQAAGSGEQGIVGEASVDEILRAKDEDEKAMAETVAKSYNFRLENTPKKIAPKYELKSDDSCLKLSL